MSLSTKSLVLLTGALLFVAPVGSARAQAPSGCTQEFEGTFALIQQAIFENRGCTSSFCHDQHASGGLDLSPEVAYDNLIDQPVQSVPPDLVPGLKRVIPARKAESLLWLNVAAATLPNQWEAPLQPMPLGGLPPLSLDELEVLRLWIEDGAPREGVVPGTGELLNACLPPPKPLETEPLAPPPPDVGVQLRAPRQILPSNNEREVCFVSYYDLTDQVPEEFRGPNGDTFRFKRVDARQDPLSHHAVVIVYEGDTPIHDPVWGPFTCRSGPRDGEACDPTDLGACGEGGECASLPVPSVACIGYGPGDASIGVGTESLFSTMASAVGDSEGVYDEAPLKGILVWNSHAFNVTDTPAKLDMWINFNFAAPEEQIRPLQRFVDVSAIFKMSAPAFGVDEVCHHYVVLSGAELLEISSHVHKRGSRFRIFEGAFACNGGSNSGSPCTPLGPDPDFPTPDLCGGAACESPLPPPVGDCNRDLAISIDELITGVNIALAAAPMGDCPRFDGDGDGEVSIGELVTAVNAAIEPALRDAQESLLYASFTYADPQVLSFDPPFILGGPGSSHKERTLTYCALYDNGFINPDEVKRRSTTPPNGALCTPTHCAEGAVGQPCLGNTQAERDRSCDSSPGSGDGFCDACTVGFGVTTDDEMFVLLGSYLLN